MKSSRFWTTLGLYLSNDDPLVAASNAIAFLVACNLPLYPLTLWLVSGDNTVATFLTAINTPVFLAVPLVSRRHPLRRGERASASACFPLSSARRALRSEVPRLQVADHDSLSFAHNSERGERDSLSRAHDSMRGERSSLSGAHDSMRGERHSLTDFHAVAHTPDELVIDSVPGLVAILSPTGEVDAVNSQLVEYC